MAAIESQKIKELKLKLHQSFLQMSDIQKIYEGQLENQKDSYESRLSQMQLENQNLKKKISELEKSIKSSSNFFLDGLDETKIEIQLNQHCNSFTLQNSFVDLMCNADFRSKREIMAQLQRQLISKSCHVFSEMRQYFRVHELYEETCMLKDELYRARTKIQHDIAKFQNIASMNQQLFKTSVKLREDNKKLAEMYREQVEKSQKAQYYSDSRLKHVTSAKLLFDKCKSTSSTQQNQEKVVKKSLSCLQTTNYQKHS